MKKIILSKEDKARLLERFNIGNVKTVQSIRWIEVPCICNSHDCCDDCPFSNRRTRISGFSDCIDFIEKYFGIWGAEIVGAYDISWKITDDKKALKFISDVRKWLNTLP